MIKKPGLFETASELLSIIVFFCGLAVLYGWVFDISVLKSVFPDMVTMKANTAICFILSALSLWLFQEKRSGNRLGRRIARLSASLILLTGVLTFYEYISGVNLGMDQLFFKEPVNAILTSSPNRMAVNTSFGFILIGIALILHEAKQEFFSYLAQFMVIVLGTLSLISFLGYIYRANPMYFTPSFSTAMALHTTILFILVVISYLFSSPKRGFMKTVSSDGPGGTIMRVVYPIAILIPMILGWFKLYVERKNIFTNEIGVSFVAIINLIFVSVYLYALCRKLNILDVMRKEGEAASRMLAAIVESSDDAIISKDNDGNILSWNKGAERMYGYSGSEIIGRNISVIIPPHKQEELPLMYEKLRRGERIEHFETERCRKDGVCFAVSVSISSMRNNDGEVIGFSTIARDISVSKKMEEELRALSLTDPLTGIYNRRGFLVLGQQQIKLTRRRKEDIVLLYIDLDRLKWINDTFGHNEGDSALIEVASILKRSFRESDIIARVGGDEFVVMAVSALAKTSNVLRDHLQKSLDAVNKTGKHPYALSLSVGKAYCESMRPCSIDELLTNADRAMYEQKKNY